jgi:hypothetical protein
VGSRQQAKGVFGEKVAGSLGPGAIAALSANGVLEWREPVPVHREQSNDGTSKLTKGGREDPIHRPGQDGRARAVIRHGPRLRRFL